MIPLTTGHAGDMDSTQAASSTQRFGFDQHDVVIGSGARQTVITGFLLDGAMADLAVVRIENHEPRVHIFAFGETTWTPEPAATLRPQVQFVDVVGIGGRDRLITYEPGRLNWLDSDSRREHELLAVTSSFIPPRGGEIPHVDVTHDLNRDGRDDLVVPAADGFRVFVQRADGTFEDPVTIGRPPELSRILGADGYRYDPWSQSRVHEVDFDHDGRDDLVFWNEDHFEVHLQNDRGLFSPAAETFRTDVVFDSDDLCSLTSGDMTGRVLHSLADLNGDGVADLVVFSLQGKKSSRKRSAYEVHFGTPARDRGTTFARDVGATFTSPGRIQLEMHRQDFDHDGQVDLMFTTIETRFLTGGLWTSIKGFMGDDVWLDLEFYRMEGDHYPSTPNTTRRIALDGVPSHREPGWVPLDIALRGATHASRKTQKTYPRAFNTTLRLGDVTGDGRSDLLIAHHPRVMSVFVGIRGPELFARWSHPLTVGPPNDEEYTWLADVNMDGKQDIVMHHPFTLRDAHGAPTHPPRTEPHRVTVLIAR